MEYRVYQKTRVFSALFWCSSFYAKHFPTVWKPVRIYSISRRRLSVPLINWSMLKWASFPSGIFRENNDLMNEGNKLLFYSLDKVCPGKFQLHCPNKVDGMYASAPCEQRCSFLGSQLLRLSSFTGNQIHFSLAKPMGISVLKLPISVP